MPYPENNQTENLALGESENQRSRLFTVTGKDLSSRDLSLINEFRKQEFGSESLIDPAPNNDDWDKLYFLVKEGERLLAFGRLHNVEVTFENQRYDTLGIATIVALSKRQGHGSQLMAGIRGHIEESGKTGFGFCAKELSDFYRKNGFLVMPDGITRFQHPTPPRFPAGDVLYLPGKDQLIEKMIQHPSEFAQISRPHW